jgi:hypothetical protein
MRSSLLTEIRGVESQLNGMLVEGALIEMMSNDLIAEMIIAEQRKIIKYAISVGAIDKRRLDEGLFADIAIGLGSMLPLGAGNVVGALGVVWYIKEMFKQSVGSFAFFMNLIMALLSSVAAADPSGLGAAGWLSNAPKMLLPFIKLGQAVKSAGAALKGTQAAQTFIKSIKVPGAQSLFQFIGKPNVASGIESLVANLTSGAQSMINLIKSPQAAQAIGKIPGASGLWTRFVGIAERYGMQAIEFVTTKVKALVDLAKTAYGTAAQGAAGVEAQQAAQATIAAGSQQVAQAAAGTATKAAVKVGARTA